MVGVPQKLSKGQEVDVIRILRNKLLTWTVVGFTILAGITGLSLWGIKERIEANMEKLVAAQFEEPRIQQVVRQVAAERASSLLAEQVNPEVTKFKADVQQELLEFNKYLHNLKEHYQAGYQKLSEELAVLKARNRITRLGDKGIHDASREALEKLETIKSKSEDPAIRGAADSEIMRIKGFWAGVTRLRGEKLTAKNPDGSEKKTEDIETKELVEFLLKHPACCLPRYFTVNQSH